MSFTHEEWLTIAEALEVFVMEYRGAHAEHDADNWATVFALREKVAKLCDETAAFSIAKGE